MLILATSKDINKPKEEVTYSELLNIVDDNFTTSECAAQEIHYETNFTKVQLELIAGYYDISKRKKKKAELIQDIVLFEMVPENIEITTRRKSLWEMMKQIKEDRYLTRFLIFK